MNIRTYGTDERLAFCREYLYKKNIRSVRDIILLPIPTSKDGLTVFSTGKTPEELFGAVGCSDALGARGEGLVFGESTDAGNEENPDELPLFSSLVVGYGLPTGFRRFFSERGSCIADVANDENFVSENARLTAEGTLGKILSEEKAAPSELSVGIIGYGRIGKRLLNLLAFLGARLTVFTSKEELVRELCMIGVSSAPSESLSNGTAVKALGELDIIINTAPTRLIGDAELSALSGAKIIELASGNNFPDGTSVLRLPSLPARMYPKSAGKVLADSVLRMLGE